MLKLVASTLLITLICTPKISIAFCSILSTSTIEAKVNQSDYYALGKAISKHCLEIDNLIYTKYKVRVLSPTEIFKEGQLISIIEKGGTLAGLSELHSNQTDIPLQQESIFFLNDLPVEMELANHYSVTYKIENSKHSNENFDSAISQNLINKWPSISTSLHSKTKNNIVSKSANLDAEVFNISPIEVVAGTFSSITISGSSFGNYLGLASIQFRNANSINDEDFVTAPNNHILSWTDSEIKVMVPGTDVENATAGAGTGPIRIITENGSVLETEFELLVTGQQIVSDLSKVEINSISIIGNFGFYVQNELIDMGALPAIERAINKWNCATGISFQILGSTDINYNANDNFNVIAIENTTLSNGLASTKTTVDKCGGEAFLLDADILLNANYNFNVSSDETPSNFYDLESTMLHELGHVHQLGHVLNEDDLMYPYFPSATEKREINSSEIQVAKSILQLSALPNSCGTYPIKSTEALCNEQKPNALFTLNHQNICIGDVVNFEDLSTQSPSEWLWLLPGSTYNQVVVANPQVSYSEVGTYDVKLIATNEYGSDYVECIDCITVSDNCCVAPTELEILNITETGATINWLNDALANGYQINIRPEGELNWNSFNTNNNFGLLSGLEACTNYEVQLKPLCSAYPNASFSNSFFFQTLACQSCIAPPSSFEASITKNSMFLTWDIIPNAEKYIFEYKLENQNEWNVFESELPILILFGLPECTAIQYKIKTICTDGSISNSSELNTVLTLCEKNNLILENFNVYPNPSTDVINISNETNEIIEQIEVFNMFGQKVLSVADLTNQIDIMCLEAGQYYLQIKTDSNQTFIPFIKS